MNISPSRSLTQHWAIVACGGLAGGLGWGIRGQYGHESGAMIAGLLVTTVIAIGYLRHLPSLRVARAMAIATVAIGIGGSMTYGQTIGLTHDVDMVGNWHALRWGMLGLAIKGSIWIGFCGMMLGHALSGRLLGPLKLIVLLAAMWGLFQLGVWLINQPYDPAKRLLPQFYFSADWYWRPQAGPELKPRREVWGGLGLALILSALAVRFFAGDRLAMRMTAWGMLGGALGFPAGQCFQAYHAWNREQFRISALLEWDRVINWWNVMETSFGFIMGVCLTLGIALNRNLIAGYSSTSPTLEPAVPTSAPPFRVAAIFEGLLLAIHVGLLICSELIAGGPFRWYSDGLIMAVIPLWAIAIGRVWPYFLLLPVTVIPIAGKTFRQMVIQEHLVSLPVGVVAFLVLPMLITFLLALWWSRPSLQERSSVTFTPWLLLVSTWIYFGLNFAFFQFPFPWSTWTTRTPNAIFYFIAAVSLTILSTTHIRRSNGAG